MKKLFVILASIALVAAACNKQAAVDNGSNNQNQAPKTTVYENNSFKLDILDGWTATAAPSNPAAVNIRKGNYILYINTNASQASGVTGGRFAEIAQGAPSADAVVTVQPSPPCGSSESNTNFSIQNNAMQRVDLYVDNSVKEQYCAKPATGTVWYFSYVTDSRNGYFNYYKDGQNPALVITMSYNSKNVNSLPVKGSAELNTMLSDMTTIAKSLVIKGK